MDLSKNYDLMGTTDKLVTLAVAEETLSPQYGIKCRIVLNSFYNFFESEGFDPALVFVNINLPEGVAEGKRVKPLLARAYNADLEPISGVAAIGIGLGDAEPLNRVH